MTNDLLRAIYWLLFSMLCLFFDPVRPGLDAPDWERNLAFALDIFQWALGSVSFAVSLYYGCWKDGD